MRIMVISDIHGRCENLDPLPNADLTLICGDITHFGAGHEAGDILSHMKGKVWSVVGNCDDGRVLSYLEQNGMSLHLHERERGGLRFYGVGGGKRATGTTPTEFSEEQFASMLPERRTDILVTHSPPHKCLDRVALGLHAGSAAIRKYIETYKPTFAFCGHIHENRGTGNIGTTIVCNPGPLKEGYFAEVDTEKKKIELKKV